MEWVEFRDSPDIEQNAQPVLLGEGIYMKGRIGEKQTAWKYCIPTKSWSPIPSPPGVDADKYVLASYRSQLVWIGGRVHTGNQEEANKKVFVYEQDEGWKENISIPPLPVGLLHCWRLFASGDDNYLVVAYDSKLLVFDGQQWQQKDGPKRDMRVLVHCGTLYLIIQEDGGGSFCKASVQSLLAEINCNWVMSKLPCAYDIKYSSLTLVGDYVTVVALTSSGLSRMLCILSLSSTSDSWIMVTQLTLYRCSIPSIVGFPTGKLLLMGLMDPQNPPSTLREFVGLADQRTYTLPQFKMIEQTPNGMLPFS